jgi:hypothetical protein
MALLWYFRNFRVASFPANFSRTIWFQSIWLSDIEVEALHGTYLLFLRDVQLGRMWDHRPCCQLWPKGYLGQNAWTHLLSSSRYPGLVESFRLHDIHWTKQLQIPGLIYLCSAIACQIRINRYPYHILAHCPSIIVNSMVWAFHAPRVHVDEPFLGKNSSPACHQRKPEQIRASLAMLGHWPNDPAASIPSCQSNTQSQQFLDRSPLSPGCGDKIWEVLYPMGSLRTRWSKETTGAEECACLITCAEKSLRFQGLFRVSLGLGG